MGEGASGGEIVGRRREVERLLALVASARQGRSGSVVIRGEPGMGKTRLLEALATACGDDVRVVSIRGAEAEMVLDFAGLQRILVQVAVRADGLPEHQRRALQVAMGEGTGVAPDPYLVGLAAVNLFSDAGADRPLLCIVDDAHWVDDASRQALGFAARRLFADRVAIVFATRDRHGGDHLDGVPEVHLGALDDSASRMLLASVLPGRLDHRVRERLLADARGRPLALVELPRALTPAELAGGFGLSRGRPSVTSVEDSFAQRFRSLPDGSRLLLLLAAAEPAGDPAWLWAAAARLGLGVGDASAPEAASLVDLDTRITFRHPLVRSAVYRMETAARRHSVHGALADVIVGDDAADHRAWHRAHATTTPTEELAADLVTSADRARRRGGIAAAAAFLDRAVDLTPDPAIRSWRAAEAATAKLDAGDVQSAARLLETAALTSDAHLQARVALLRARLAFAGDRGREGPRLLLAAARAMTDHEPFVARETYLEALMAAMIVGRLADDPEHEPEQIARAARSAPPPPTPPRAVDLLLDGLVLRLTDGYRAAAATLQRALTVYRDDVVASRADPRWHDITNRICLDLFDFDTYRFLATRQLEMLRDAGELTVLPAALATLAAVRVLDGAFDDGQALLDEALIVSVATGAPPHRSGLALLAAHRGDEVGWRKAADRTVADASGRGEGTEVTVTLLSQAMLNNGMARFSEALDACRTGRGYDDVGLQGCLLFEAVEAAAHARDLAVAREVADVLIERAGVSRTASALGMAARAGALAKGDRATDADYRDAISQLERSPLAVYRARTHLVYGEWLRRAGRRDDARVHLRLAHEACVGMGADGFAQRAARELEAAGGTAGARGDRYDVALTTQERHISRLVQQGKTNAEIGMQLLISHRTVEWHLRNIYAKLDITSRRQLRDIEL